VSALLSNLSLYVITTARQARFIHRATLYKLGTLWFNLNNSLTPVDDRWFYSSRQEKWCNMVIPTFNEYNLKLMLDLQYILYSLTSDNIMSVLLIK